jgi:hypothetical protein
MAQNLQTTSPDIYIGGKQFKQPNPPVKPKWDADPPDVEPISGGAKFDVSNPPAAQALVPEPTTKNLKGLSGVKRK